MGSMYRCWGGAVAIYGGREAASMLSKRAKMHLCMYVCQIQVRKIIRVMEIVLAREFAQR